VPLPKEEFERLLGEWHRSENAALRAETQLRALDESDPSVAQLAGKASGLRRLADQLFARIAGPSPQPPRNRKQ
jgi:hypothetical protein